MSVTLNRREFLGASVAESMLRGHWCSYAPAGASASRNDGLALGSGLLTTAGRLLFAGDVSGNLVAFDPANGNILWHSAIGQVSNAPQTS